MDKSITLTEFARRYQCVGVDVSRGIGNGPIVGLVRADGYHPSAPIRPAGDIGVTVIKSEFGTHATWNAPDPPTYGVGLDGLHGGGMGRGGIVEVLGDLIAAGLGSKLRGQKATAFVMDDVEPETPPKPLDRFQAAIASKRTDLKK